MGTELQRVLFKVSGQSLENHNPLEGPINFDVAWAIANGVAQAVAAGIQVAVMPGGGNILRGSQAKRMKKRVTADHAGMMSTMVNALVLVDFLEALDLEVRLHSTIKIEQVAAVFSHNKAISQLQQGMVVVLGCGTGRPFFTTDTGAVQLGAEMGATLVAKGTHSYGGVFTADPATSPEAVFIPQLTYDDLIQRGLRVMDLTSITHARENKIPVRIFRQDGAQSITRALSGEDIGSLITA